MASKLQIITMVRLAIGADGVKCVRTLLKLANKAGSWNAHFLFCCSCEDSGMIPPSLRCRPKVCTSEGIKAAKRFENANLRARIHQASSNIRLYRDAILKELLQLSNSIPDALAREVAECVGVSQARAFHVASIRQQRKKDRWYPKSNIIKGQEHWVRNLSKTFIPTEQDVKVLSKGLNYAVTKPIRPMDVIAPLEAMLVNSEWHEKAEMIRAEVAVTLKHAPPIRSNLTKSESNTLQKLKKMKDIHISKADKGNVVVITDESHYSKLCWDFLSNGDFAEVPADPTRTIENRLVKTIRRLRKEKNIDDREYWRAYSTSGMLPVLKGLPKLHKNPVSIRPIVTYNLSPLMGLSKLLADIFKPLQKQIRSSFQSAADLAKTLSSLILPKDYVLVSFDVVNLYPSVPHQFTLDVVKKKLNSDHTLQQRTSIPVEAILELVDLCLKNTYFGFEGKFFHQKVGSPMGSPLSEPLATLLLDHIEQAVIKTIDPTPSCWVRFVDDTLAILHKDQVQPTLEKLNGQCSGIVFTCERENNGAIPFLDMLISRKNSKLSFDIYRKPTHSGLYFDYSSEHPYSQKLSIPRTLANRARTICSDEKAVKEELKTVKSMLLQNNFPSHAVDRSLQPKQQKKEQLLKPAAFLPLPYSKNVSHKLAKVLTEYGIQVIHKPVNKIQSILQKPMPVAPEKCSGVVYKINCGVDGCAASYIGETGRRLEERIKEHRRDVENKSTRTALALHTDRTGHVFDFSNPSILQKEIRPKVRLQYESLAISACPSSTNIKTPCNPLYSELLMPMKNCPKTAVTSYERTQ